jgi:hypothetical protein
VLDLAHRLREAGARVNSNPEGDLFTSDPTGRMTAIFEVITGTGSSFLEKGVARLLLRSLNSPQEPRRILVVPGELEQGQQELLLKLGIHVIPYSWETGTAVFAGLSEQLGEKNG